MILIMIELNFLCESKILARLKKRTKFALTCFENKLVFPIYVPDQKFENLMDLWLVIDEYKSHYMYIKDFDRFMFHKTKNKNKKYFCKRCLQCFSSRNVLTEHKEVQLSINDGQSVRLEKGTIAFRNYFKQIPAPFKIYADFQCNLKSAESYEGSYSNKYQDYIPCSFAYKPFCADDKFSKPIVFFKVKMLLTNLLKQFLKSMNIVKM